MLNRPLPAPARDVAMLIARVILGVVLFAHGWQKLMINGIAGTYGQFEKLGIPLAIVSASFASFVEFVGGVLIILGALTTTVVALDLVVMVGAAGFVHVTHGIFAKNGGWELVGVIVAAELALAAFGPGRLSVDHLVARRRDRERADLDRRRRKPVRRPVAVSEAFTPAVDPRRARSTSRCRRHRRRSRRDRGVRRARSRLRPDALDRWLRPARARSRRRSSRPPRRRPAVARHAPARSRLSPRRRAARPAPSRRRGGAAVRPGTRVGGCAGRSPGVRRVPTVRSDRSAAATERSDQCVRLPRRPRPVAADAAAPAAPPDVTRCRGTAAESLTTTSSPCAAAPRAAEGGARGRGAPSRRRAAEPSPRMASAGVHRAMSERAGRSDHEAPAPFGVTVQSPLDFTPTTAMPVVPPLSVETDTITVATSVPGGLPRRVRAVDLPPASAVRPYA